MTFHHIQFPTNISYGTIGGPSYSTSVVEQQSGHEQRNINWHYPRARYNLAPAIHTHEQLEALLHFFHARKGRGYGFRFKDWCDYTIRNQPLATGDGNSTQFPLVKRYQSGGYESVRRITKPVDNSVEISLDNQRITSGITIDHNIGVVTFDAPPAADTKLTLTCEFDVPVRFDTDELPTALNEYGVYASQDIPLIELKEHAIL